MTKEQIATVCHVIEDLEESMPMPKIKMLFTKEAFDLFEEPVFECVSCSRKVSYNDLVNADEMTVDEVCDGFCTCADCMEENSVFGVHGMYVDGFSDLFADAVNILNEMKIRK